jgi:hypothetical protein
VDVEQTSLADLRTDPKYAPVRTKWNKAPKVSQKVWDEMHTDYLVPLDIVVDMDALEEELKDIEWQKWVNPSQDFTDRPNYAYALTDGKIEGATYWPNDLWNMEHPDQPLIDTDFDTETQFFKFSESLTWLYEIFAGYWARSHILRWDDMGHFRPHVDTPIPAINYRLWATNKPEDYVIRFEGKTIEGLEKGRVYLIDTSKVHEGWSTNENVLTLFLSVNTKAKKIIEDFKSG